MLFKHLILESVQQLGLCQRAGTGWCLINQLSTSFGTSAYGLGSLHSKLYLFLGASPEGDIHYLSGRKIHVTQSG